MKININTPSLKLYAENLIKEVGIAADEINVCLNGLGACSDILFNGKKYSSSFTLADNIPLSPSFINSIICGRAILDAVEIYPPYGTLGGVRPFKSAVIMKKAGLGDKDIYNILTETMKLSDSKAKLVMTVCDKELETANTLSRLTNPFGLYISVPFCPSRCNYCSFISSAAPNQLKIIPAYLDELRSELLEIKEKTANSTLTSIYIGGGTPTVLNEKQLEELLKYIRKLFEKDVEFTLEAGRPDTVTDEKLNIAKAYGVTRISINCQSLNDKTLMAAGRHHTANEYIEVMRTAKKKNFHTINTDIIAGFEEENISDFKRTVDGVLSLEPENITVHSLCLKKASDITIDRAYNPQERNIDEFINFSHESCILKGYRPYYMYRQKYSAGNHENTGFAKLGHESLYNIAMMSELMSIYGAGAGASTKIVENGEKKDSYYNCKYPTEYIDRRKKNRKEREI